MCLDDDECLSGICQAVCATIVQAGGACSDGSATACADGLTCENDVCTAGPELTFAAGNGQPCDLEAGTLCASGHFCALSPTGGTCKRQAAVGQPCEFGLLSPCVANAYCDGLNFEAMPPVTTGTCVALPGAGDACLTMTTDQGEAPAAFACEGGLVCEGGNCAGG